MREWDYPRGVALAVLDSQRRGLQIHVVDCQRQKFCATNAGGVEHFHDCAIAYVEWFLSRRGFQQPARFILRQHVARQSLWLSWWLHQRRRIVRQLLCPHQPVEEGLDRCQLATLRG